MNKSPLSSLLRLRVLVGFLGERAQCAWWPTAFYQASSQPFLEPAFAKTFRLAQYHGVLEAARRLHDEHLSVGSYHLFRLPEEVEQDLHSLIQRTQVEDRLLPELRNKDIALMELKELAGEVSVSSVGPTSIGGINDLYSPTTIEAIAAAYLSAFSRDTKVYPYLVGRS